MQTSLQHDGSLTNVRKPVSLVTFMKKFALSAEYFKLIGSGIALPMLSKCSCSSRLTCVTQSIELVGNSV